MRAATSFFGIGWSGALAPGGASKYTHARRENEVEKGVFMKRKLTLLVCAAVIACLCVPMSALGATFNPGSPTQVSTLTSSTASKSWHNYLTLTTSGTKLTIQGETTVKPDSSPLQYAASVQKVGGNESSKWIVNLPLTKKSTYYTFSRTVDLKAYDWDGSKSISNGEYVLIIAYKKSGSSTNAVFYKNAYLDVTSSKVSLMQWNNVVNKNSTMRSQNNKATSKYLDKKLSDYKNKGVGAPFTTAEANYISKVANSVVGTTTSTYTKAKRIYDYVANKFYYDDLAFSAQKNQYTDVYTNLYNQRNNKKSANSTANGKVATTCVGDAGIVTAMARAVGIPARICNGHHVGLGTDSKNSWDTEVNIGATDHWWAELYINGAWRVVDPTAGSGNHWKRSSFSAAGTWSYQGVTNYASFLPTDAQFATTYVTYQILGGTTTSTSTTTAAPATPKAPTVTNVAASGKPYVKWSAANNASKYQVWTSTTGKSGSFKLQYTTTGRAMTHYKAIAGKKYWYKIRAVNSAGKYSGYSAATMRTCDYARPAAPKATNVIATGKPRITWTGVTNAKKYQVWVSTTGKTGSFKLQFTTTGKAMTHNKGVSGKKYWYKVRAIGNDGAASAYSLATTRTCRG